MRFRLLLLLSFTLLQCKHFWGNPYRNALAPRVVPVRNDSLHIEPSHWWTGLDHNQVNIRFQRPGLAGYSVRLQKTKGLKITKIGPGEDPNVLLVTLKIAKKAPPQKAGFVFSKGTSVFTGEFPIRATKSLSLSAD